MARIKDLDEMTAATIAENDELVISDTSDNKEKKLKFSSLVAKLFGGKTPGGGSGTDITQNNAVQELTNKSLVSPKINGDSVLLATSAELNKLHNLNVSKAEIGALAGITGNVQERLSGMVSEAVLAAVPRFATIVRDSDHAGDVYIDAAQLKAILAVPEGYEIRANVIVSAYRDETPRRWTMEIGKVYVFHEGWKLQVMELGGLTPNTEYTVSVVCSVGKA